MRESLWVLEGSEVEEGGLGVADGILMAIEGLESFSMIDLGLGRGSMARRSEGQG